MMRTWFAIVSAWLLISGCATRPRTTPEAVGLAVRRHTDVGLNHVFYMGTRRGDHYLLHQHAWGSRVYRLDASEVVIDPVFPYTRDPHAWRLLTERWWPESVEGRPLVFREQASSPGGDLGTVRIRPVQDED